MVSQKLKQTPRGRTITNILLGVIALILVGWALKAMYIVVMPLVFAFFLAVLVRPVQTAIDAKLPRRFQWVGVVAAMTLIVAGLAAIIGMVWLGVSMMQDHVGEYAEQLEQYWNNLRVTVSNLGLELPLDMSDSERVQSVAVSFAERLLVSMWEVVGLAVLIFFFVLLMLLEAHFWKGKADKAISDGSNGDVLDTVDAVAAKVRIYILVRMAVSAISGAAAGLWLWIIGVDFALLWGVLTFILNFIPSIGSVLSTIAPTLVALVQPDGGLGWALTAAAGLTAIEQVIGNYIDPRLQGKTLQISPVLVLTSVIFWGWLWDAVGAILGVPLTVSIIVIMAHIPALQPIAMMLGRTPEEHELPDDADGVPAT